MPPTVTDLLDSLRSLRLLEPEKMQKLADLQARIPDAQTLAKKLVESSWLTKYQVNLLYQGKGKDLVLGSYILLDRIGEGGMGEVYRAKNWKLGQVVALKVIRKDRLQNENSVRRFKREVTATAKLSHPNIVRALDADQSGNIHFLAMEFVEGGDLLRLVKTKGPLPVPQACEFMHQAALGLQHAFEQGMVHRDIKPSNLLVDLKGTVRILDMGLARMEDAEDNSATLTQEGSVLGSLDYLSPEQALNARAADTRSDLYSLGCTFYFILTGQVPFPGGTATEKLLKHRLEEPKPIEQIRADVPAKVTAVVRKLMAKKPEDRFQTGAELAAALAGGPGKIPAITAQKPLAGVGTALVDGPTIAAGPDTLRGTQAGRGPSRMLWLGIGMALPFLLCCTGGIFLAMLKSNDSDSTQKSVEKGKTSAKSTQQAGPTYVKMGTREETILATLKSAGYPTLEGKWHSLGFMEFGNANPPETELDLKKAYPGRGGRVSWRDFPGMQLGQNVDLKSYTGFDAASQLGACVYLYREIDVEQAVELPLYVFADDWLVVWLNGKVEFERKGIEQWPSPEQRVILLKLNAGKNKLLLKAGNFVGEFWVNIMPHWPKKLENLFGNQLRKDFPR
ncbi:MAG: serine/threonine protein kinase [Planctomycetia bacterium]|nr:serine/threonine protein kinase [Planctomycetia bacterium]